MNFLNAQIWISDTSVDDTSTPGICTHTHSHTHTHTQSRMDLKYHVLPESRDARDGAKKTKELA